MAEPTYEELRDALAAGRRISTVDIGADGLTPEERAAGLAPMFGAPVIVGLVDEPDPSEAPSAEATISPDLVERLRIARQDAADAKARADEVRDVILGQLKAAGSEYGVDGAGERLVHAKTIVSKRFDKAGLAKDRPDLVDRYTVTAESVRLDIL